MSRIALHSASPGYTIRTPSLPRSFFLFHIPNRFSSLIRNFECLGFSAAKTEMANGVAVSHCYGASSCTVYVHLVSYIHLRRRRWFIAVETSCFAALILGPFWFEARCTAMPNKWQPKNRKRTEPRRSIHLAYVSYIRVCMLCARLSSDCHRVIELEIEFHIRALWNAWDLYIHNCKMEEKHV